MPLLVVLWVFRGCQKYAFHDPHSVGNWICRCGFRNFIGWTPLNGMLAFTTVSSILVGELSGAVQSRRESVISAISGLFIGLGILFLSLSNKNSSYATNIYSGV